MKNHFHYNNKEIEKKDCISKFWITLEHFLFIEFAITIPDNQAKNRLYPPLAPSTSKSSPPRYRFFIFLDEKSLFTSDTLTPPQTICASLKSLKPLTVNLKFLILVQHYP